MNIKLYYGQHAKDKHPAVDEPKDKLITIWRYTNFIKLISLFENRALYFASITTLNRDDPFEGVWSIGHWKSLLADRNDDELTRIRAFIQQHEEMNKHFSQYTYVNCWHMSSYESQAMWRLYGNEVAIKSNISRLAASFRGGATRGIDVYIGKVKYIDYVEDEMYSGERLNFLYAPFRKNKSFEHERELRAVVHHPEDSEFPVPSTAEEAAEINKYFESHPTPPPSAGVNVAIDPSMLIEGIYLSPRAEGWYTELVASMVARYELDIPIYQSQLNSVPKI